MVIQYIARLMRVLNFYCFIKNCLPMTKEHYAVPVSPNACKDFESNAIDLCTVNAEAWGIPAEKLTKIQSKRTDYEKKYATASNRSTQSPGATAARDASWELLKTDLIDIYDHNILNNDAITVAHKQALCIRFLIGGKRSTTPTPTTTPVVTLASEEISVLYVVYSDSATPGSHAKPDNVAFCELKYKVDVPPPSKPDECLESVNISRSHTAVVFTPDQRGNKVFAYARWVNVNGKTGPWSGQITAIVP